MEKQKFIKDGKIEKKKKKMARLERKNEIDIWKSLGPSWLATIGWMKNLLLSVSIIQLPPLVAKLEFNLEKAIFILALRQRGLRIWMLSLSKFLWDTKQVIYF